MADSLRDLIFHLDDSRKTKEGLEVARRMLEEKIKKAGELELLLFNVIAKQIEELLGEKIFKEGRWVYAFGLNDKYDQILEVTIAENIEGEVEFFTIIYDLKNKSVIKGAFKLDFCF